MNNKKLFGYDKHMKSIYDNSIIKFLDLDAKKVRIGHLWYDSPPNDDIDQNQGNWVISFNHLYSETSIDFSMEKSAENCRKIANIRVIGFGPDDEHLMKHKLERGN